MITESLKNEFPLLTTSRRRFLKTLGAASWPRRFSLSGLIAQSPNRVSANTPLWQPRPGWSDPRNREIKEVKLVAVAELISTAPESSKTHSRREDFTRTVAQVAGAGRQQP